MLTKLQTEILELFRKNIFFKESILQIAKRLGRSYPKVHGAVKALVEEKLIKIEKAGKTSLIYIELTPKIVSYLAFLEEQEAFSKAIPNGEKILEFKEFIEDIVLITGSYAEAKQIKGSDIDLVIITKQDAFRKQKLLENLTALFLPRIHPIVITERDFIEMLLSKEENFGKQIFRKRLIFRNAKQYYSLIKEAIENGFRG